MARILKDHQQPLPNNKVNCILFHKELKKMLHQDLFILFILWFLKKRKEKKKIPIFSKFGTN